MLARRPTLSCSHRLLLGVLARLLLDPSLFPGKHGGSGKKRGGLVAPAGLPEWASMDLDLKCVFQKPSACLGISQPRTLRSKNKEHVLKVESFPNRQGGRVAASTGHLCIYLFTCKLLFLLQISVLRGEDE